MSVGASQCALCPKGTSSHSRGATSNSNCTACPAGTYSDAEGATSCKKCDPGTHAARPGNDAREACLSCGVGKYQNASGAAFCFKCPHYDTPHPNSETTNGTGSVSEHDCKCTGSYHRVPMIDDCKKYTCEPCDENYYRNQDLNHCVACPELGMCDGTTNVRCQNASYKSDSPCGDGSHRMDSSTGPKCHECPKVTPEPSLLFASKIKFSTNNCVS